MFLDHHACPFRIVIFDALHGQGVLHAHVCIEFCQPRIASGLKDGFVEVPADALGFKGIKLRPIGQGVKLGKTGAQLRAAAFFRSQLGGHAFERQTHFVDFFQVFHRQALHKGAPQRNAHEDALPAQILDGLAHRRAPKLQAFSQSAFRQFFAGAELPLRDHGTDGLIRCGRCPGVCLLHNWYTSTKPNKCLYAAGRFQHVNLIILLQSGIF